MRDDEDRPRHPKKSTVAPWWAIVVIGAVLVGAVMLAGKGKNGRSDPVEPISKLEQEYQNAIQDETFVKDKKADMTVVQFDTAKPDVPKTIRANIEANHSWDYGYAGTEETHYSFRLTGGIGGVEHVWMHKDTPGAKSLHEMCKDGKKHWVTIRAHRIGPDGTPTSSGSDGILILDVIADK
jgi:hypothetical protein